MPQVLRTDEGVYGRRFVPCNHPQVAGQEGRIWDAGGMRFIMKVETSPQLKEEEFVITQWKSSYHNLLNLL